MKVTVEKTAEKQNRHRKRPGMARRLSLSNILTTVVAFGTLSDQAVIAKGRTEGLFHDRAFNEHQTRFKSSLTKLKNSNPFTLTIPPKVEAARLASAMKSIQGE